ncbi:MAG: ABC transporter permease [Candidatus Methanomethylophilaceae archaeon]|nr:ABC transporter permease [Candidatus Methanomethylophilaceae archaeon]MBR7006258.1 ABC transporter permease [Candidatus Methanomethylophilaceae archaeon]
MTLSQALTVAAFETRRKIIGWRFPIAVALALAIAAIAMATGSAEYDEYGDAYLAMRPLVNSFVLAASIAAVVLGSTDLSTEFDKSTGFVMFTRAVGRTSIFAGKHLSAVALTLAVSLIYIAAMTVYGTSMCVLTPTYQAAVGEMVLYALAASGAVAFISSVSPTNSVSTVASFLLVVVLPMVMSSTTVTIDLWPSLAFSSKAITSGFMWETTVYQVPVEGAMFTARAVPIPAAAVATMAAYFVAGTVAAATVFRFRPRRCALMRGRSPAWPEDGSVIHVWAVTSPMGRLTAFYYHGGSWFHNRAVMHTSLDGTDGFYLKDGEGRRALVFSSDG